MVTPSASGLVHSPSAGSFSMYPSQEAPWREFYDFNISGSLKMLESFLLPPTLCWPGLSNFCFLHAFIRDDPCRHVARMLHDILQTKNKQTKQWKTHVTCLLRHLLSLCLGWLAIGYFRELFVQIPLSFSLTIQRSWPNIHGRGEGRCIDNVWTMHRYYIYTWYIHVHESISDSHTRCILLLNEYRKKRFEENARVNSFVSPCPKTCCRTNTLWTNLCHLTQPSVCRSWKRSAFCGFIFSGCIFEDGWIGWGCMHLRLSEIGQGEVTLSKWAPFLFSGTACYMDSESTKHATSCTMED